MHRAAIGGLHGLMDKIGDGVVPAAQLEAARVLHFQAVLDSEPALGDTTRVILILAGEALI